MKLIVHNDKKRLRYEARTDRFLLGLALLYVLVYSAQVIPPWVDSNMRPILNMVNLLIWLIFIGDLMIRVYFADRKLHFLATHPVDVASVIVPALRPIRALRVFTASRGLLNSSTAVANTGIAVLLGAVVLIYIGALAILDVERFAPGSQITNIGDALWWAIVTVTTVGYGDVTPVTTDGRFVAAGLMIVGISVLGAVSATVAGWLVSGSSAQDAADSDVTHEELRNVKAQLAAVNDKLDRTLEALGQSASVADAGAESPPPASSDSGSGPSSGPGS